MYHYDRHFKTYHSVTYRMLYMMIMMITLDLSTLQKKLSNAILLFNKSLFHFMFRYDEYDMEVPTMFKNFSQRV